MCNPTPKIPVEVDIYSGTMSRSITVYVLLTTDKMTIRDIFKKAIQIAEITTEQQSGNPTIAANPRYNAATEEHGFFVESKNNTLVFKKIKW